MARQLKVFRTAIGFHDAYVAVPSQKAALQAWGSDSNLFGSGLAELVTDPALSKAPLAAPGEVIKVKRGTAREHLAALPEAKKKRIEKAAPAPKQTRPRRTALDRAETALAAAEKQRAKDIEAVDQQIKNLQAKRRALADKHRTMIDRLQDKRDRQAEDYEAALQRWRDQ